MMNLLKKLAACGLSLTMILSLAACGGTDDTSSGESGGGPVKYLIGISQYGQHGSLDNCREGFLQGLEQAGLVEGTDFEVDYPTRWAPTWTRATSPALPMPCRWRASSS